VHFKKIYVCFPRNFLVINVCIQGKTLCSPCSSIVLCRASLILFRTRTILMLRNSSMALIIIRFVLQFSRLLLKCDGTREETRFRLSEKRTSPFKSAGVSVQSTTGSRGVRISGINAGYTMFRGSVKSTGYSLHSSVSPSLPLLCITVCHHVSTGFYHLDASLRN
jgi:hypothetical protein